jgi:N-acetylglutamate synthase-like GNAT family acetyltransferase
MNCENLTITQAAFDDLRDILDLLSQIQLRMMASEMSELSCCQRRIIATHCNHWVGASGHYSVATIRCGAPEYQGWNWFLTEQLLERATNNSVERVVLLTSTASEFFSQRFGFCTASRANFHTELAQSSEWNLPRCSSAVCISLDLRSRRLEDKTSLA